MNILVFGLTENPGGVESFLFNYISIIESKDLHFDFLCNTKMEVAYEKEFQALGCAFYKITARSESFFKYRSELKSFFQKYAGIYDAMWVNVCSLANIDYLKMAKKHGIAKRIIHSHNSENMDGRLRKILHWLNRNHINRFATHFWACSDAAGRWFYSDKIMHSSKYRIVKNAIDTKRFVFSEKDRVRIREKVNCEGKCVWGNVGRLHFQKNQTFLLDIFYEAQKKSPDIFLMLVGQGPDLDMLREKAKRLGIFDKVVFLGVQSDISSFLSAMDIFLFPSVFEGLGIAAIEAQASGLPVLASDKVIPADVKLTDDFRFVSLEKSAKGWAEEVLAIAASLDDKRTDRAMAGRVVAEKGFDIEEETVKLKRAFWELQA